MLIKKNAGSKKIKQDILVLFILVFKSNCYHKQFPIDVTKLNRIRSMMYHPHN